MDESDNEIDMDGREKRRNKRQKKMKNKRDEKYDLTSQIMKRRTGMS